MSLHTTVVNAPTIGKVRISSCNPINIFVNGVYMGATGNDENPSRHDAAPHGSSTTTQWALKEGGGHHRVKLPSPAPRSSGSAHRASSASSPGASSSGHKRSSAGSGDEVVFAKKQKTADTIVHAGLSPQQLPSRSTPHHHHHQAGGRGGSNEPQLTDGPDLSRIHLEVGDDGLVPVFDTCDEVRLKINEHMRNTPGLTAAQFCRDLYVHLAGTKFTGLQSKQLNDFKAKEGPRAGCSSSLFYAAYVFFEKMRIAQGQPKSRHRISMESIWASQGGFDLKNDGRHGLNIPAGKTPVMDEFGRIYLQ
ncbi:hypothetical protein PG990_008217 [Apiospora arundinis]|uniref:Glucan endo-1-3-beta-glucosidase BGN13.1 n=1 Tax=Apiospora arundinis TaxID=335852 RepID=A0ABR2JMM5_9PEZI